MVEKAGVEPKVIAEISGNHRGKLELALGLVRAAKTAGAHYVKLQHYTPQTITARSNHADFLVAHGLWKGRNLWGLYEEAMTPWEWTGELAALAAEIGISWFSSPFDESAVDFLEDFGVPCYKVASFEIIDLPLIRYIAQTGKPIILSTGMASLDEIDAAVDAAVQAGAQKISLLRTNSGYPAQPSEMNLSAIPFMMQRWGLPVGLSDHSIGNEAAIVAASLGATLFEKHLTLRRSDGGPDSAFSSEPEELSAYVDCISSAHESLGHVRFGPTPGEMASLNLRPSLRAVREIARGEQFCSDNVQSIRPSGGLPPDAISAVLGQKAAKNIAYGDPVTPDCLD